MGLKNKNFQTSHEENENDELWAISYGDMITLLLSFFVVYFSTDFKKNVQEKTDNHLLSSFKIFELKENRKPSSTGAATSVISNNEATQLDLLKNAKVTKLNDQIIVTFDPMNFFKKSEIEPTKEGEEILKAFAQKFLPYASLYKVSVKAFTDKRKVKHIHRYKDNMELSALRALAALRVLQHGGIPLNRLEIAGYGEMDKLHTLLSTEKIKLLDEKEMMNLSRTLVLIIKHDNEQNVL